MIYIYIQYINIYTYIKWTGGLESQFLISNLLRSGGLSRDLVWQGRHQGFIPFFQVDTWCVCSQKLGVQNCDCENSKRSQLSKKISMFFFSKSAQQQLHVTYYKKNAFLFGEGFPNYPGYTHFVEGTIGWTLYLMDPSWWMDVSCGVLGPGFRWISRIHWTSSPSSTGATAFSVTFDQKK